MANEISFRSSVNIKKGKLDYRSSPTSFNADIVASVIKGPTPGAISIPIGGVAVDLSQLGTPGVAWFHNQDDTEWVEVGIHDGSIFHPLLELGPGECYPVRLSRHLNMRETVTGTGTISTEINDLWVKPLLAVPLGQVTIHAFER